MEKTVKTAKTDNFLQAIQRYAQQQRESMRTEVEQLKEEKIKEAEIKGKADSEKYINNRLEKKKNEETRKLAKELQDSQRTLFLKRCEMTDSVFEEARERLSEYTKTPQYTEKLLDSARKISELFGENECTVFVNERDLELSDKISAVFGGKAEIKTDSSVKIGGIKGYCEALSIVADETLDSRLDAQREWFVQNSNLSVL